MGRRACLSLRKTFIDQGVGVFGLNGKVLIHQLQYTAHERPYLSEKIDFNISHSEGLVACAISDECRVGLDVERVRSIQLSGFRWQMTAEEWTAVINAQDSQTAFLQYWTKKEAAIKAHGRGMSLELKEIVIEADHLMMEGQVWALYRVELVSGYVSHLVTNKEVNGLKVSRMML